MKTLRLSAFLVLSLSLSGSAAYAVSCADTRDTYNDYDNTVDKNKIKDLPSEYYVLSYTWSPDYCKFTSEKNRKPGGKDYLQCGSGANFGYILHGLWPQGKLNEPRNWPIACEGDQPKIDRKLLEKYLCMTPSVWILQHEYEYHGTCMHDEALETPEKYFDTAMKLHSQFTLPDKELHNTMQGLQWWLDHNHQLSAVSIRYSYRTKEWQFCYDTNFQLMACPDETRPALTVTSKNCPIKGNISNKSKKKYYFTSSHPQYAGVQITPATGERCFANEQEAVAAGWTKAPER